MSARKLVVAAAQVFTDGSLSENAGKIRGLIREAIRRKVDLVAFPEAALSGYRSERSFPKRLNAAAIERELARIRRLCRSGRIAAAVPTAYRDGKLWRNGIVLIEKNGREAGRYVKTFHAGEKWAAPKDTLGVYALAGVKTGCIVCHDVRYPELVRLPVINGARLILFCSNESGLDHPEKLSAYHCMPISRATENGVFLVMANAPAVPARIKAPNNSHGESKIVAPTGQVLAKLGHFEEGLVTAEIDLRQATAWIAKRISSEASPILEWIKAGKRLVRTDF